MIEFTMSRVAVTLCGMLMLAAVIAPVGSLFTEREDAAMQNGCDSAAEMIDIFCNSPADTLTVPVSDIVPSPEWGIVLKERFIILTDGEREYVSPLAHHITVEDGRFDSGDYIRLEKTDGDVRASSL